MGDEARPLAMQLGTDEPPAIEWACVNCDGEPWGIGVWADQTGYPHAEWTAAAKRWAETHDIPLG